MVGGCSPCPATCAKAITVSCEYIGVCGDGFRRHSFEQCDDGNTEDGDGCSSSCMVEPGWLCDGGSWNSKDTCFFPVCGDMMREGPEGCDDGNLEAGDGSDRAHGFDQKDGMKACNTVGMQRESIPFYLQP